MGSRIGTVSAGTARLLALAALLLAGVGAAAPRAGAQGAADCWSPADEEGAGQWSRPPDMVIDPNGAYTATVETNFGAFAIELFAAAAPIAVNNFICLAEAGYYDDTPVHRVIADFVIQGGDPTGTGTGGPGYDFEDEPVTRDYERGTVAMANAGPDTNGSQFFVCLDDLSDTLPKNYTIFGQVTEGLDVIDAIAAVEVEAGPSGEESSPVEPVTIERVTITEGDAASGPAGDEPSPASGDEPSDALTHHDPEG